MKLQSEGANNTINELKKSFTAYNALRERITIGGV